LRNKFPLERQILYAAAIGPCASRTLNAACGPAEDKMKSNSLPRLLGDEAKPLQSSSGRSRQERRACGVTRRDYLVLRFRRLGEGEAEGRFAIVVLFAALICRFALAGAIASVSLWGAMRLLQFF